jgi:hypothetical protein
VSASERTSRTTRGISGTVMATITVVRLARVTAISAMASRMPGMAMRPSITRMIGPSAQRTKPDTRPSTTPKKVASTATAAPTIIDTRPPHTARLNTSRPSASVPNQCSAEGVCMRASGSMSCGSCVAIHGAAMDSTATATSSSAPTISVGCLRSPAPARRHERGVVGVSAAGGNRVVFKGSTVDMELGFFSTGCADRTGGSSGRSAG